MVVKDSDETTTMSKLEATTCKLKEESVFREDERKGPRTKPVWYWNLLKLT